MGMGAGTAGGSVSEINVTPLIDVLLVLLIIFMVVTPMLNHSVNVELPKVTASTVMENASKEDAINVSVTRDGKTFLGADPVAVSDLGVKVADLLSKKTNPGDDKSVYLHADSRANYGKVMDTIDGVRVAGVSQLNLLTDINQTN